jgi:hypothetical protein
VTGAATQAPALRRAAVLRRPVGLALAVAAQAAVFGVAAVYRTVDVDEGSYALASRLVLEGKLLYSDFVYYQLPLLPYVYGAWTAVAGETWYAARLLSALLATATGALLFAHLARRYGPTLGALGVTLYASTELVTSWFVTVKTYALSTLLLVAAYAVIERGPERRNRIAAGVLLGLAVDTRAIFAAAVPALGWAAARTAREGARARAVADVAGGLLAGLLPTLLYLAYDPGRFLFDTVGAQANRSSAGLIGDFGQKARLLDSMFGAGQLVLLGTALAIAIAVAVLVRRRLTLALVLALLLGGAHLLPTPTYDQYFATIVPFAVLAVIEAVAAAAATLREAGPELARAAAVALASAATIYVGLGALEWYYEVRGTRDDVRVSRIEHIRRLIDSNSRPGEEVMTSWPGYLFGSHARPVPGLEDGFAPHTAAALTERERERYRVASAEQIERMIRDHRTRLLVVRDWHALEPFPDWDGAAQSAGYRLLSRVGDARLYAVRRPR